MKTIERLVLKYLINIVYVCSSVLPIQKRVVFATNRTEQLSDNFKYIYEEMQLQKVEYQSLFLLKKMGFGWKGRLQYLLHLLKATYYLATSKYFLIDDFYFPVYVVKLRKGTEVVQTWHACGAFKKFGYSILDKEYGADNNYVKYIPIHKNYSHVLVSAQEVVPCYAEAFNMEASNIRPLGIPRTDLFFKESLKEKSIQKVYQSFPELKGKKLVLYAPTFRGATQADMHMEIPFNLDQVLDTLEEGVILGLKMHPFVRELPDLSTYSNVVDLSTYPEINDLLLITDLLITDYSSIVFEYSLLERPMIFYAHDQEQYIKERDFYYEYETFIPGPLVQTTDELIQVLTSQSYDLKAVKTFKETFFDCPDGRASERFVNQILLKKA